MSDLNMGVSLIGLAIYVVGWGGILSSLAVLVVRKAGPRWLWVGWILAAVTLTTLGTIMFHRAFPDVGTVFGTVYTIGVFVGMPTATIAAVATRISQRNPVPNSALHIVLSFAAYTAATPLAVVLAALPDIARTVGW